MNRPKRKLGEMLKAAPKNTGSRGDFRGRDSSGSAVKGPPENNAPTYRQLKLDKKTSAQAQKIAALPTEKFEKVVSGKWRLTVC